MSQTLLICHLKNPLEQVLKLNKFAVTLQNEFLIILALSSGI